MADITDRILSDMSKIQNSSKGRSYAKSRAKQENRRQVQVLTNLAKALGNKAISAFQKKVHSIEKSMIRSKSKNQRVTIKSSYTIEHDPNKAKILIRAHAKYITRESGGSDPFTSDGLVTKKSLELFADGIPEENAKYIQIYYFS